MLGSLQPSGHVGDEPVDHARFGLGDAVLEPDPEPDELGPAAVLTREPSEPIAVDTVLDAQEFALDLEQYRPGSEVLVDTAMRRRVDRRDLAVRELIDRDQDRRLHYRLPLPLTGARLDLLVYHASRRRPRRGSSR